MVSCSSDPGGATNQGITQGTYNNFRKSKKLPTQNVRNIAKSEVQEIYRQKYWNTVQGDKLPKATALQLFDYAVHSGPQQAVKDLQRAAGLKPTGTLSNTDIATIKTQDDTTLAKNLLQRRRNTLHEIINRRPASAVFQKGWNNRLDSLQKAITAPQQPGIGRTNP